MKTIKSVIELIRKSFNNRRYNLAALFSTKHLKFSRHGTPLIKSTIVKIRLQFCIARTGANNTGYSDPIVVSLSGELKRLSVATSFGIIKFNNSQILTLHKA